MIPKFRAYNGSTNRMYEPREVMVCNGNIYIDDEDFEGWTGNNDLSLMPSTGLFDKNGVEIFEGDVVTNSEDPELKFEIKLDVLAGIYSKVSNGDTQYLAASSEEEIEETREDFKEYLEVIGNIYENPELVSHA